MRSFALVSCGWVLLCTQFVSVAQTTSKSQTGEAALPSFIVSGLQAYKEKGPEEALRTWIKGSALEGSKDALAQANALRQIQDYYGQYQAFEVVSTRDVSPRTRTYYLVLDFEKGPVFAKFVSYRSDQGWILAYFNFNTKEEAIFPSPQ
jgi:hypothetical protein